MSARDLSRLLGVAALVLAAAANAQTMRDPTRPPGAGAAKAGPAAAPSGGGLVLQSILISQERRAAVISGRVVGPGESINGYMLVGLSEGEAVLKNGGEVRRLRLYPAVDLKRQRETHDGESAAKTAPAETQ
jgi:MSHA biogenesis protein MshK